MADHVFTDDNFEEEVLKSDKPVLVDFFAEWCGPCKMLAPVIDEIAKEQTGWKVGKLDVDRSPMVAQKYGIQSIPTLLFFRDGEVVDRVMGFKTKDDIMAKMN